jgi:hypothetical protein
MYFLTFLNIVAADLKALFAPLIPLLKGGGEVLLGQGCVHVMTHSLLFLKVCWVKVVRCAGCSRA